MSNNWCTKENIEKISMNGYCLIPHEETGLAVFAQDFGGAALKHFSDIPQDGKTEAHGQINWNQKQIDILAEKEKNTDFGIPEYIKSGINELLEKKCAETSECSDVHLSWKIHSDKNTYFHVDGHPDNIEGFLAMSLLVGVVLKPISLRSQGGLLVLRHSHRRMFHDSVKLVLEGAVCKDAIVRSERALNKKLDEFQIDLVHGEPGTVVLLHPLTLHGSDTNIDPKGGWSVIRPQLYYRVYSCSDDGTSQPRECKPNDSKILNFEREWKKSFADILSSSYPIDDNNGVRFSFGAKRSG